MHTPPRGHKKSNARECVKNEGGDLKVQCKARSSRGVEESEEERAARQSRDRAAKVFAFSPFWEKLNPFLDDNGIHTSNIIVSLESRFSSMATFTACHIARMCLSSRSYCSHLHA